MLNSYIVVVSMQLFLIGTLFVSTSNADSKSLKCGVPVDSSESPGPTWKHAKSGAWPWMAVIMSKNGRKDDMDIRCTGFLITRRHVLTVAHCLGDENTKYEVRVGNNDWRKADKYSVEKIKFHEQYNARYYYDDIAILTLKRPADDPNVNAVCLPEGKMATGNLTGSLATVAGWNRKSSGPVSNLLSAAAYEPIISNWECNRKYNKLESFRRQFKGGISPALLCAGAPRNSCVLSGSPLMLKSEGKWQAIGITSFGYGCGSEYPEGFTRVSYYLDWIKRNTDS